MSVIVVGIDVGYTQYYFFFPETMKKMKNG
jgi:hypothetical protein